MFKSDIIVKRPTDQVFQNLKDFGNQPDIKSYKLTNSHIDLLTKINSYNGFGLKISGDIESHGQKSSKIKLNISTRHDFLWFNVFWKGALLVALFYDKTLINGQILVFTDKLIYVGLGFIVFLTVDIALILMPWIKLKRKLINQIEIE